MNEYNLQAIDRMGKYLLQYSLPKNRSNIKWLSSHICKIMNIYTIIKRDVIPLDMDNDHNVYFYIVNNFFNSKECNACSCISMKNNRIKIQNTNGFEIESLQNILDGIHVSLLHGYDTGHKLYPSERREILAIGDANEENWNDLQGIGIRSIISKRQKSEMNEIYDETQQKIADKFVTHVNNDQSNVESIHGLYGYYFCLYFYSFLFLNFVQIWIQILLRKKVQKQGRNR